MGRARFELATFRLSVERSSRAELPAPTFCAPEVILVLVYKNNGMYPIVSHGLDRQNLFLGCLCCFCWEKKTTWDKYVKVCVLISARLYGNDIEWEPMEISETDVMAIWQVVMIQRVVLSMQTVQQRLVLNDGANFIRFLGVSALGQYYWVSLFRVFSSSDVNMISLV